MSPPSCNEGSARSFPRPAPAAGQGLPKLARLLRLVAVLQSGRNLNARKLADLCDVSHRTIYRDIEVLEDAGFRVRFRPETQGYQVERGYFLPPTNLTELQAIALLVLSAQWEATDGLGLASAAREAALKAVQTLPEELRARILAITELAHRGPDGPEVTPERQAIHQAVLGSLTRQRQLRLWYRETDRPELESTKFGLYRLLLRERHWYMVGRSTARRRTVVIGLPWVERAQLTDDRYTLPPRFDLARFLARWWGVERAAQRYDVWVRLTPMAAPLVFDRYPYPGECRVSLVDGGLDLHLEADGLDEVFHWVQGFGDQAEVLSPPELRDRLLQAAARVAALYGPGKAAGPVGG